MLREVTVTVRVYIPVKYNPWPEAAELHFLHFERLNSLSTKNADRMGHAAEEGDRGSNYGDAGHPGQASTPHQFCR
jgi:hypothetical protein